jgi:hypothetical protein
MQVKPGSPSVEQNSALKEKKKASVAKHWKAKSEALDVSGFHTDPGERMVMYSTHTHRES